MISGLRVPVIRLHTRKDACEIDVVESGTWKTFLGTQVNRPILNYVIEKRNVSGSPVAIGKRGNEWIYAIEPVEHFLAEDKKYAIESLISKLPESDELDLEILLKDHKLAGEIVRNHINERLPRHLSALQCDIGDIASRYSVGYGPLELILRDPSVEDIVISSPCNNNPVCISTRLNSSDKGSIYCETNLRVSEDFLKGIITRTRIFHGGELSFTKPVLEVDLAHLKARMSTIIPPASRHGPTISIRRRKDFLWSIPRLIADGSLSWTAGGFLSICCAARASIIIAGGRGSGKTTLLSALLPEMPTVGRTTVMEDTEELPVLQLQGEGMSLQSLSLAGGIERATSVMRAALRIAEGAIIVGEIRGEEARILFESIRTGTAASCVIGTLHASDFNSVRDRIIIDMNMNPESFRSIDLVVMARLRKNPSSGISLRSVSEIDVISETGECQHLFRQDENDILRTNLQSSTKLGGLADKICSQFGIKEEKILMLARMRGFLKMVQGLEWRRTGDDRVLSVRATRAVNSIPLDPQGRPDVSSLKESALAAIRGCL
ncbi:MAG: ATPase, T2SS/T4P/T4SS family [Thermoplasmata archaeon]